MNGHDLISRRRVLEMSVAMGGLVLTSALQAAESIRRTPSQILGPFYPLVKPTDQDADLTMIAGRGGRAAGQVIQITGQLTNRHGQPLPGARIEIWQANTHGRYTHPSDRNSAPLDPNFEGYALLTTDAEGRYAFKTIKPGAYPEDSGVMRAPHIHFEVSGKINRLVTQMFFAGESLNDEDRYLRTAAANRERLIVSLRSAASDPEADLRIGEWNIVLDEG
jgi:protocatechuate 3,4-dioxygenase beta subunit